jgi:peptide/nickel transport system permease protein
MWTRRLLRHLIILISTALLGGFLGASLVRWSPGSGVDERELDTRLNAESIQALRQSRASDQGLLRFYAHYLAGAARGDLGVSRSLGRPVAALFAERIPVTLRSTAFGLLFAWLFSFALALPGAMHRKWLYDTSTTAVSGLLLCLPSAVLALLVLYFDGPVPMALALAVSPQIFRYVRNILLQVGNSPHILTANAKGLSPVRILFRHVLPPAAPPLLGLIGVSVSMALGAAIPIEAICDSPGIGQLAWQAALGRDLPLLVNLTVLTALITLATNSICDLAGQVFAPPSA